MKSEWLYVGYLCAFFAVYISSILLSIAPTIFHESTPAYYDTSYVSQMNATVSGIAGISSSLPIIGIVLTAGIVVSVLVGSFAFNQV